MNISQLIKKLEEVKTQYGDLPVCRIDYDGCFEQVEDLIPTFEWKIYWKEKHEKPWCIELR